MQRLFQPAAKSIRHPLYSSQKIRIISYNVLADKYKGYHPYCPDEYLAWSYRWPRIVAELHTYKPDLLFLQEVEQTVYDSQLQPWMQQQGYCSMYQPRQTPIGQQGPDEGVSLHFHSNTFALIATQRLRFADAELLRGTATSSSRSKRTVGSDSISVTSSTGSHSKKQLSRRSPCEHRFLGRLTQRPEGCIMALLQHKPSDQLMLVCSTHLFWDPMFPDVKVAQAAALCSSITQLIRQQGRELEEVAVVVAGDFNSLPEKYVSDKWDEVPPGEVLQSGVYQLMQQGCLLPDHPDHPANRTCSSSSSNSSSEAKVQQQQQGQRRRPRSSCSGVAEPAVVDQQQQDHAEATVVAAQAAALSRASSSVPAAHTSKSCTEDSSNLQQDDSSSHEPLARYIFNTAGLVLDSSYHMAHGREPVLTTRTATFSGCLDYIWLSKQHFQVTHTLEMPYPEPAQPGPADQVVSSQQFAPCPNELFPSDHLAVGCDVMLLPGKQLQERKLSQ